MDIKKRIAKHDTDIQGLIRLAGLQQKNLAAAVKEGRETRRMLLAYAKEGEETRRILVELSKETEAGFKELRERSKETDERIQALVSAIGEFISRLPPPTPAASKPPSPKRP